MFEKAMKYKDHSEHVQIVNDYYEQAVGPASISGIIINDFDVYYEHMGGHKMNAPYVLREAIAEAVNIHNDMIIAEAMNILQEKLKMFKQVAYEEALEFVSDTGENK